MATIDEDEIRIADDFRKQLQERLPAYEGDNLRDYAVNEMNGNPNLDEFMSTLGLNTRKIL